MNTQRRPAVTADVQAAWDILDTHQLDPDSGLCDRCGSSAPCDTANDAAYLLVTRGYGWPPDLRPAAAIDSGGARRPLAGGAGRPLAGGAGRPLADPAGVPVTPRPGGARSRWFPVLGRRLRHAW